MRIIRDVVATKKPPFKNLLIQGEVLDDYVCPETVKVYGVWVNFSGEEMVGPELTGNSKKGKLLAVQIAERLTRRLREHDCGDNKHEGH
tara:strand:- start:192 stop:458 length:267 start_codon:yes stop_codon:yes gene_type:complete